LCEKYWFALVQTREVTVGVGEMGHWGTGAKAETPQRSTKVMIDPLPFYLCPNADSLIALILIYGTFYTPSQEI
jgi:hypothetical protein